MSNRGTLSESGARVNDRKDESDMTVAIGGIMVDKRTNMPTWEQDGATYHINLTTETFHVTKEGVPKIQYFFKLDAGNIDDVVPTKSERGRSKVKVGKEVVYTKNKFSDLPAAVQQYVRTNYRALIG